MFLEKFNNCIEFKQEIINKDDKLGEMFEKYDFFIVSKEFNFNNNSFKNFRESNAIIIDYYEENPKSQRRYFIIGFKRTILIISDSLLKNIRPLFMENNNAPIYYFPNAEKMFSLIRWINNSKIKIIRGYSKIHHYYSKELEKSFVDKIFSCVQLYLIEQYHNKPSIKRIEKFIIENNKLSFEIDFKFDSFVQLDTIGNGSSFICETIYSFEREEVYLVKKVNNPNIDDFPNLMSREYQNYLEISHPFIPKFYGRVEETNSLVIEYIKGKQLCKIRELGLTFQDKLKIVFELMIVIEYLHQKNFVYRDLHPQNIIIDGSKDIVLIDFDRMIKSDSESQNNRDYPLSEFADPYIEKTNFSFECDIHSIGLIIYYIFNEHLPENNNTLIDNDIFTKYPLIKKIYLDCTKPYRDRPSLPVLINSFYENFQKEINIEQINEIYNTNKIVVFASKVQVHKSLSPSVFKDESQYLKYFVDFTKSHRLETKANNAKLDLIINSYDFHMVSEYFDYNGNEKIYQNIKESIAIMIGFYNDFFIIGFKQTIIIIQKSSLSFIETLFKSNAKANIYFFANCQDSFNSFINVSNPKCKIDSLFIDEILEFKRIFFYIYQNFGVSRKIWNVISSIIAGFLIKQSYYKVNKNRIKDSTLKQHNLSYINENDYIELRTIGTGSSSAVSLAYHIEKEELIAIKRPYILDPENEKLHKRELLNYSKMNHPFVPKLYGETVNEKYLVVEYINGRILNDIKRLNLTINEKITIIFELMIAVEYLHRNHFILRDLKPNNVIIDNNKSAVLIDFDRMITVEENESDAEYTLDLYSSVCDPVINENGRYSQKNDIYLLGIMIEYIINEGLSNFFKSNQNSNVHEFPEIERLCLKCKSERQENRPTIFELICEFYSLFYSRIEIYGMLKNTSETYSEDYLKNLIYAIETIPQVTDDPEKLFDIGTFFFEGVYVSKDLLKAIDYYSRSADQNYAKAQFKLGSIYSEEQSDLYDIEKAVHYYSLAANQNYAKAQYKLGSIYSEEQSDLHDIRKAIHYYSLAANQNYAKAQCKLGSIYSEEQSDLYDIEKAIHCYSLAANQNYAKAQCKLGSIYSEEQSNLHDIRKAIHYYSLAANQNYAKAQCKLGSIYSEEQSDLHDIRKAIHYYSLAANQNYAKAQCKLGSIYSEEQSDLYDIEKAIHCYSLAANQNYAKAQCKLGSIYSEEQSDLYDIEKAIHCYSLAANQNYVEAQCKLGSIYSEEQSNLYDIRKAIHYYSLAAKQNYVKAQYNLGLIYYESNPKDINMAFHYLKLAAKQNDPQAQLLMGLIFYDGIYVMRDIKEAIRYFTLAANQKEPKAQFYLNQIRSSSRYNIII
ncbi:hypothetical protein M9Y10_010154 [Tritrichomonas musculus]|uniref:Protein kinase domain-containing protein n=1 Tax=Tritrichomonas musculus TaxID=1915356 RepID=A0ABR2IQG3_9EUKA